MIAAYREPGSQDWGEALVLYWGELCAQWRVLRWNTLAQDYQECWVPRSRIRVLAGA